MDLDNYIFQQDNDPKHTSLHAKRYFQENDIHMLDLAAQSPDFNLIENLWALIDKKIKGKISTKKVDLINEEINAWNGMSVDTC